MEIQTLAIGDVKLLTPRRFHDPRGFFAEVYSRRTLAAHGIDLQPVQENQSLSRDAGVMRGLHFQAPPYAQTKLVRVLHGSILDIVVDFRAGSPTYGQHVTARLSAASGQQILVPAGFGHGVLALEPNVEICYLVDNDYAPECEGGVRWDDPDLGISLPMASDVIQLSEKDAALPDFRSFETPFRYTRH